MKIYIQKSTSFLGTVGRTVIFLGTLGAIVSFGFGVLTIEAIGKKYKAYKESKKFDPDDQFNNW